MSIFKYSEKLALVILPTSVLFCLVNDWYAAFDPITADSDWVASFHNIIDRSLMCFIAFVFCTVEICSVLSFSLSSNVCIDDPLDVKH